ncbi:MAG: glycosyltransferase family 39 protein [Firmicutes bacterium]|nr:glycosyltransferase family 39 protein [Bacillota bacterium]
MNETLNLRQPLLHKICIYMFATWCAALAALNAVKFFLETPAFYVSLFAVFITAGSALVCLLLSKPLAKLKAWQLVCILFAFSLALKLSAVFLIAPEDFSDFWTFRVGAASIARGDVSFVERLDYYKIWAYQFGFEWMMSPFFKLFGQQGHMFGLILNSVFAAGCTPLVFANGERFLSRRNAVFAALLFTVLPITVDLSSVFTNQQVSAFFNLLAVFVLIRKPGAVSGALAGLCFCLAKIARPDEIVYVAAVSVAVILLMRTRRGFLSLACMLVSYFAFFKLAELAVSPLQPYGLGNGYPLYKFVVGFNEASYGTYSAEISKATFENEAFIADHVLRDAETKRMIGEELSIGPLRLLRLFGYKTAIQWTGLWHRYEILHDIAEAGQFSLIGRSVTAEVLQKTFAQWDNFSRALLMGAASAGGFIAARRKEIHLGLSVFMLAFMAFSAVALLVEVQYRYSYFVFPALCFAAVLPLERKKNG